MNGCMRKAVKREMTEILEDNGKLKNSISLNSIYMYIKYVCEWF